MKRNNTVRIRTVLFGVMVVGALGVAPSGWCSTTISDNFNDGNDTFPTMDWQEWPLVKAPIITWASFPVAATV